MKRKQVLDLWTREKIKSEGAGETLLEGSLQRKDLDDYTENKLRETLKYAVENSSFYREKLEKLWSSMPLAEDRPKTPMDGGGDFFRWFRQLPFTDPEELRRRGTELLCVGQGEISRIVTLDTSGSTGLPKRVYFTEEDQQLTVDFFQHGMQLMVGKKDTVLVLMPARMPGSIGKLLQQGLENFGAQVIPYGLPQMTSFRDEEANRLLTLMKESAVTAVVALPTHMSMLAEAADGRLKLDVVLLSAEYVADEDVDRIASAFACKVYQHYGMTEMGLGCAVSCGMGEGYHIRESDLYLEIIDPDTGQVLEDQQPGEIVFTTLTRKGMPLIRYRSGDISHWITEECPCGSVLKRLAKVEPRPEQKGMLQSCAAEGGTNV